MLVGNFTPDNIHWTHLGQMGDLGPGSVEEFDEKRANFILTKYGPRGLVRVNWEDREDLAKYKDRAMQVYREFWIMQIETFNEQNAQRKNENKAYVYPTKQQKQKAEELGLELEGPWKTTQKTDSRELREMKAENAALKEELKEIREESKSLQEDMRSMLELMKEIKEKPATPVIRETADFLQQFQHLGEDRFQNWVMDHIDEIPDFPLSVYEEAFEKWSRFYKKVAWPVEKCRGPK